MSWTSDCKKMLQALRKSANAELFLYPVDWKGLGLTDYPEIVKEPMDLQTMATKLQAGEYASTAAFAADMHLIVKNCKLYNAEGSPVFQMAEALEAEFEKLLKSIKRWQDEAKKILASLKKNPNAFIFLEPVDWKSLGLTDYLKVIKTPMDLGTVGAKLASDQYASIDAFFDDLNLVWSNCMVYNADGSDVYKMAAVMKLETEKFRAAEVVTAAPTPAPQAVAPKAGPGRRKSQPQPQEDVKDEEMEDEEDEKRREDFMRMGKRFASLQHDYLASAVRFIYAKCPKAVRPVEGGFFDIDFVAIGNDSSCCHSVNQLVKVMLYLQQNPE